MVDRISTIVMYGRGSVVWQRRSAEVREWSIATNGLWIRRS